MNTSITVRNEGQWPIAPYPADGVGLGPGQRTYSAASKLDFPAFVRILHHWRWLVLGASQWQLKFPAPVRVGDHLRLRLTVQGKRESSRPERGHFDLLYELVNQAGDLALSVLVAGLIARRPQNVSRLAS